MVYQPTNSIFFSHQINQQYFQSCLISQISPNKYGEDREIKGRRTKEKREKKENEKEKKRGYYGDFTLSKQRSYFAKW